MIRNGGKTTKHRVVQSDRQYDKNLLKYNWHKSALHCKPYSLSAVSITSRWTHDVITTWSLRQNDVATPFWRYNDVNITSCVRRVYRSKYGNDIKPWKLLSHHRVRELNPSPPGQHGRHFAHDIFICIFTNEKFCISIRISLKCVPKGPIGEKSALVQVMAWHRTDDKPLPDPKLTQFTDAYMRH